MKREMAAVIKEYGTLENEILFLTNQNITFSRLCMDTKAGLIQLNFKEVKHLFNEAVNKGFLFSDRSNQRIIQILGYKGSLIEKIENPDFAMQIAAVRNSPYAIKFIKNPFKEVKREYLIRQQYEAVHLGYCRYDDEIFRDFSAEEITEIVREAPASMSGVPSDLINQDMVHAFLESMIKQNLSFLHGGLCNIPQECLDKTYWQCMCIMNGYNYHCIPEEKRLEYITPEIIYACLNMANNGNGSFVGVLWMYQYLPDCCKTEEISRECILSHFACLEYLPKQLQNASFYIKLAEETETRGGNFAWFKNLNPATISKKVFEEMVVKYHITSLPEKTPASYFSESVAIIASENANMIIPAASCTDDYYRAMADNGLVNRIPSSKLNQELCFRLLRSRKSNVLRKIPEEFKTRDLMEVVVTEGLYDHIADITDYLSKELVAEAVRSRIVTSFDEIPVKFQSQEITELLIEQTGKIPDIPEGLQTEEICSKWLQCYDKAKYEWLCTLKKCKFKSKDNLDYAVRNFADAVTLGGLSKEQIQISVEKFPLNILKVPAWYFEKAAVKKPEPDLMPENVSFVQMSIFDIIGTY